MMSMPYPYDGLGTFSPKVLSYSVVRKQVSQGAAGTLGLKIIGPNATPTDADEITLRLYRDGDFDPTNAYEDEHPFGDMIREWATAEVTREEKGVYSVPLGANETRERGNLAAVWTYRVGEEQFTYTDFLRITEQMPTYDALRDEEKAVVEQVSWMFGDLFDSTDGGPHLVEPFQTHFNYERIAQLMHIAIRRLNTQGVPMMNWQLGGSMVNGQRLPEEMGSFLTLGTYLEVLLHFMRSYVEQPVFTGMNVTYTDRRDYLNRWKMIYDDEKRNFDQQLKYAKRRYLGLGSGALLVAGGIYGRGGWYRSGTYAMQTRSARFYPLSSVIIRR